MTLAIDENGNVTIELKRK